VNDKGCWPYRFIGFFRSKALPPLTLPGPKRSSGPRVTPENTIWHDREYQSLLGPQCEVCHENLMYGMKLNSGKWCAQCTPPDELPPAA
jgi:hypothetical protein